ncbi:MAG: NADH-quinone oxidoreductase subunit C [Bacteriovorax sp.]
MHNQIAEFLNKSVPGCSAVINEQVASVGDKSITVESSSILDVCKALKSSSEFDFNVLQVITGTDYADRIELSYILASFTKNLELILKTKLPRGDKNNLPKINSVVSVWNAANFQERETYDMMGVEFVGHPDFRRILCPYDWDGHPLRKDYVVQEKYLDMVVDPPGKNNTDDHMFGKRLKEELGDPKLVSASWKESTSGEEAKDGE